MLLPRPAKYIIHFIFCLNGFTKLIKLMFFGGKLHAVFFSVRVYTSTIQVCASAYIHLLNVVHPFFFFKNIMQHFGYMVLAGLPVVASL